MEVTFYLLLKLTKKVGYQGDQDMTSNPQILDQSH